MAPGPGPKAPYELEMAAIYELQMIDWGSV